MVTKRDDNRPTTTDRVNIEQSASGRWALGRQSFAINAWFGVEKARGLIQKEGKWGSTKAQCLTQLPNIGFTLFHKNKHK